MDEHLIPVLPESLTMKKPHISRPRLLKRRPALRRTPTSRLTTREREIVAAILDGCTNKEVAERFRVSQQTVKNQLSVIFDKVGVSSRLELALAAIKQRLIDPVS